jgi:precorrin-2 dehydrogenase / sirohydrochlorin ferrochelatase
VVVGGGAVASRKVGKLLQTGAEVVVVSPEVRPELASMDVEIQERAYKYGDLEGANLVFTATDSREVNAAVAKEAKERGVPINVADRPSEGDFAVPSALQRGGLQVAVSTGGASPTLARRIRDELEEAFGPEWAGVVEEFDTVRRGGGTLGQDLEEEVSRCLSRLRG